MGTAPTKDEVPRLARNSIGLRQVLAQCYVANGPLGSVTVALTGAAAFGLGSLPLVFVLGAVVILLWINTPYQFSKHIQTSGAMYSITEAGIGRRFGVSTTVVYLFGYMTIIAANGLFATGVLKAMLSIFGVGLSYWLWIPISVAILVGPYILTTLRVRPSLNYGLITVFIELAVLLILSIALIAHAGHANTIKVFGPSFSSNGWRDVIVGAFIASNSLAGCESGIGLGEEAKTPRRTIGRALLISQLSIVLFYVLVSYALTIGWGPAHMITFAANGAPGLVLVQSVWGKVGALIVGVLILNSLVGLNMGCSMFAGRILVDIARDGHVWAGFTRISAKHQTPSVALTAVMVAEMTMALVCGLIWGPITGGIVLIVGSTAGLFIGEFGADAALAIYGLKRRLNFGFYIVIPVIAIILTVVGVWANFFPVAFPTVWGPLFMVVLLVAVLLLAFSRRSRRDSVQQAALAVARQSTDASATTMPEEDSPV